MTYLEESKKKKIYEILSIVKLSSLLFSSVAIFRSLFTDNNTIIKTPYSYNSALSAVLAVLLLSLIYAVWSFSTVKRYNAKHINLIQIVENLLFLLIFFSSVIVSGAQFSDYKFLFLFIIITTTIQSGMKQGMAIACISAIIILSIDLIFGSNATINQQFENDLILAGVFVLTAWPLGFYVKIESNHIKELEELVNIDGLTGVYNHRFFHDMLRNEINSSAGKEKIISLIFIDIDYFKHYNDLYGHQKGDEVLRIIGALLKNNVRNGDVVARYGGEEFAVILPDTLEEDAVYIAERIRGKIEENYFEGEENQPNGKLTVSIGLSVYPYKAKNDVDLIKSADDALYRAKFFNKNRVETYSSILDELKNDIEAKHIDLVTSIKTLISVINAKDKYTYGHVERVVVYSRLLADKLKLSNEEKKNLIYGAYMHDIGKINIPREILNKKMPLYNDEWETLKQHPFNGVEIIKPVKSLENISTLILHHHERYDGKGYPDNLKGEEIPYLARVLTVVDSFDAMTSSRPYSRRKTYDEAVEELKKCKGSQFDPDIADAFIEVILESKNRLDE